MKTEKEKEHIEKVSIVKYCIFYTMIVSYGALISAVLSFNKYFLAGILLCVTITFVHSIIYLYEIKELKREKKE